MRSDPSVRVRSSWVRGAGLGLVVWLIVLGSSEVGLRSLARSSDRAWGGIFGLELPPFAVFPPGSFVSTDFAAPVEGLVVDGRQITRGDLWGFMREDELLGYAPDEGRISANGWWQTNSIGARSRHETPFEKAPGTRRWLAFGDSYTNGSRVPQEAAWPNVLDRRSEALEVVNLGVDGYGMAQSYLRYTLLRSRLEHDVVLLTFVPSADLARDVNVLRGLMGWKSPLVMPRFVLEGDQLELAPPLYANLEQARNDCAAGPSRALREHLRRYDRLYLRSKHESPRLIGKLVLYKLLARVDFTRRERRFRDQLMKPESEAARVSIRVFEKMAGEVAERSGSFVLVVLPMAADLDRARKRPGFRAAWDALSAAACPPAPALCVDLLQPMLALPRSEIDVGRGSHYGPRANAAIARLLWKALEG